MPEVITRFAPSPTGHLHIGGGRTALFCWAFARRHGGTFLLRIEDTDQTRSSEESTRGILEDLAWLGIDWDEGPQFTPASGPLAGRTLGGDPRGVGPFYQAQRVAAYNAELERLVRSGRAYAAFEGAAELDAKRAAAVAAKQTYRYERPADVTPGVFNEARWKRAQAGETHVVRFVAPADEVIVRDEVLGEVRYAAGEMDDFVIRKADGFPTYHFAVVCDDAAMGVTHVLRAQEHLNNTPRHVALQAAMGYPTPMYGHMPLICNMDGSKMSKRDKAKAARAGLKQAIQKEGGKEAPVIERIAAATAVPAAEIEAFLKGDTDAVEIAAKIGAALGLTLPEIEVHDFRRNGYLPGAINNFVSLLGWNPGMKTDDGKDLEKFDTAFLAEHFGTERIGKTASKFDRVKLASFNSDAINAMSDAEFARGWRAWLREEGTGPYAGLLSLDDQRFAVLAAAVKPRAKTYRDALRPAGFALLGDDFGFDAKAVDKNLKGNDGLGLLRKFRAGLDGLGEWTPATIHAAVEKFVADQNLPNPGPIAQAVRVALTGAGVSPGLGETLFVIGRERSLKRIDRCLAEFGA